MAKFQFRIPQGGRIDTDYLEDLDDIFSNDYITKYHSHRLVD